MAFKSDAHRRWWFANRDSGGTVSGGSGDGPGAGFVVMTAEEKSAAARERNDGRIHRNDEFPVRSDEVHTPGKRNPMPQMTDDEKSDFAKYRGDFK